jgi:AraC-like DNA-binding protein
MNDYLLNRFNDKHESNAGIPTVQELSQFLETTPRYLTDLLKSLTGLSAQQHIHEQLIEKAKIKLSHTTMTVSEIAYQLGFEHPQSFSKFFKQKTKTSPIHFRESFK